MNPSGLQSGRHRGARSPAESRPDHQRQDRNNTSIPAPLGLSRWQSAHPALTAALDLTTDAVYFVSLETLRICAANAAAAAQTGYEVEELVGMRISGVVTINDGYDPTLDEDLAFVASACDARGLECGKHGQSTVVDVRWQHVEGDEETLLVAVVREDVAVRQSSGVAAPSDPCDALTALPGRSRLAATLRTIERQLETDGLPVALLFLDVDGFKQINDAHGHLVGDRVLQTIARRLLKCVRPGDLVVRYGGDEFVVLLHSVQARRQVDHVVSRIATEIQAPIALSEGSLIVSASIGVALGHDAASARELLHEADQAMYRRKRASRRVPHTSDETLCDRRKSSAATRYI